MKFFTSAAVAASILSSAGLVTAGIMVTSKGAEVVTLGGTTVRIPQVYNQNFQGSNMSSITRGMTAMLKAYKKYGSYASADELEQILEGILQALAGHGHRGGHGRGNSTTGSGTGTGTGTGSTNSTSGTNKGNSTSSANQGEVSAVPEGSDTEYLAAVQIGTPPQTLNLDFDTGSSDLWVFSSQTPTNQQNGQKLYQIGQSSTAKQLSGSTWSIGYGDGSRSSGNVFMDRVTIGGITVESQAVESATNVSASFTQDTASSGLLGLAFSTLNTVSPTKQKTFFDNAMSTLASPLFTANLKKGAPGNYNFGFIDPTEFNSGASISYVPLVSNSGFWEFQTTGFAVGNGAVQSAPHSAIADTGTTLLLLPQNIVTAYYAQVPSAQMSQGGYVFSCSENLPDLTLDINGYAAVVPASVINFAPETTGANALCFGGIQAVSGLNFAIYGDIFLKSQFTVFDGGNSRIGFAPKPVA